MALYEKLKNDFPLARGWKVDSMSGMTCLVVRLDNGGEDVIFFSGTEELRFITANVGDRIDPSPRRGRSFILTKLKEYNEREFIKFLKYKKHLKSSEAINQELNESVTSRESDFVCWFISNEFEVPQLMETMGDEGQVISDEKSKIVRFRQADLEQALFSKEIKSPSQCDETKRAQKLRSKIKHGKRGKIMQKNYEIDGKRLLASGPARRRRVGRVTDVLNFKR